MNVFDKRNSATTTTTKTNKRRQHLIIFILLECNFMCNSSRSMHWLWIARVTSQNIQFNEAILACCIYFWCILNLKCTIFVILLKSGYICKCCNIFTKHSELKSILYVIQAFTILVLFCVCFFLFSSSLFRLFLLKICIKKKCIYINVINNMHTTHHP